MWATKPLYNSDSSPHEKATKLGEKKEGIAGIELDVGGGAHARIRTGDLFLTKEMLYRLSYVGGACARFYLLDTVCQLGSDLPRARQSEATPQASHA